MISKLRTAEPRTFRVKPRTLETYFALACLVTVIFSTPGNELSDDVTIQFIPHVAEKIANGDGRLIGAPFVQCQCHSKGLALGGCLGTHRV